MAKKTDQEIQQMCELYAKLKNYSAVARELKISPSTVSKYVKLQQEQEDAEKAEKTEYKGIIKDIKDIPKPQSEEEWQKILEWTPEEWEESNELRKEGVI